MPGLIEAGPVRANGPVRGRCGLAAFVALAGCLALQGCASLDQGSEYEYEIVPNSAGHAPAGPAPNPLPAGIAANVPSPAPAPPAATMANTTLDIPVTLASGVATAPAPAVTAAPAVVPDRGWETLPPSLLGKEASPDYRLAPEDILGVWIGGVLGELDEPPPVRIAKSGQKPSGFGFPIPVRADGTLVLPLVAPIPAARKTLEEVEEAIRHAYTVDKQILKRGRERIVVTLMRPRECPVVVIRQDTPNDDPAGAARRDGRGLVQTVHLPATENDVLHALALTGGHPRPDVATEIVIERASAPGTEAAAAPDERRVCITLNYPSSHRPLVRPQDVVLHKGDVVVVRPIQLKSPAPAFEQTAH